MKKRPGFKSCGFFYSVIITAAFFALALPTDAGASVFVWDSQPSADGYKIYYSTDDTVEAPDPYVDVGNVLQYELCLLSLDPCVPYWIRVAAYNASGEIFITAAMPYPNNVPQITNGPLTAGISYNAATIQWTTDVNSTSTVNYGTTTPYGLEASSPVLETNHTITLTGLNPNTVYHYRVSSYDSNNCGPGCHTSSNSPPVDNVFTTQPAPDMTPPVITSGPTAISITDTSATIEWTTDEPSSTSVYYDFDTSGEPYAHVEGDATNYVTTHSWVINGLTPDTIYYCEVKSTDAFGNGPTESNEITFTTLPMQSGVPAPPSRLRVID